MKTTKFGVVVALLALVGVAGGAMAQEKQPAVQPTKEQPATREGTKPKAVKETKEEGTSVERGGLKKDAKAKDKPAAAPAAPSEADMKAMMDQMMALAPEHAHLKQYLGTWTTETTWSEGDVEHKSAGTATFTEVYGGRYVKSEMQGEMMGAPFTGSMLIGYNKNQKKFEGTWIDSWSTQVFMFTGTADSTGKVITTTGMMDDPMTGQSMMSKQVTTFKGDVMTFEMYGTHDGHEMKMMTITYTKTTAKPAAEGHGAAHGGKATPATTMTPAKPANGK